MHAAQRPCRVESDPLSGPWAEALRLIGTGASRREAARLAGMNAMTVWNRLERYRVEQGWPPLPDARRGPRARRRSGNEPTRRHGA